MQKAVERLGRVAAQIEGDAQAAETGDLAGSPQILPLNAAKFPTDDIKVRILHSGVGAPLAGALLEQAIAMGCRSFVVCGGAGALRSDLPLAGYTPDGREVDVLYELPDRGDAPVKIDAAAVREVPVRGVDDRVHRERRRLGDRGDSLGHASVGVLGQGVSGSHGLPVS